jgi:hypothetical protein
MKPRGIAKTLWVFALGQALVFGSLVYAQTPTSPIQITLGLPQQSFGPTEPIPTSIRVKNITASAVYTREGFFGQDFHLKMTILDPDGLPVPLKYQTVAEAEPGPPYRVGDMNVALGEMLTAGAERVIGIEDCRAYYTFPPKYGWYTAEVRVPLEVFPGFLPNMPAANLVNLGDPGKLVFNPLVSNKFRFEVRPPEPVVKNGIQVNVSRMQVSPGTKPVVQRKPLENAYVRLFREADIPQDFFPIGWKVYETIWSNVKPVASQLTNSAGNASFASVQRAAYLVLVECPVNSSQNYVGSSLAANDRGWTAAAPIQLALRLIQTPSGGNPGKTTKLSGSQLLITQPEFVEWDGSAEAYAFVFESEGAWEISTSVAPPEGFSADYKSLDVAVNSEIKAVQFTITDVGSKWVETDVDFKVKHAGKTEKVTSKIGIKLSKELAKAKKKSFFGDTEAPGPFSGGRKVKEVNSK